MHGEDVNDESRSSYRLFMKMANDNRGSSAVQFGLSVCPDFVSTHSEYPLSFDYTMRRLYDDSGIGAFGVLGFVPDHVDLPTSLKSWLRVRIETLSVAYTRASSDTRYIAIITSYKSIIRVQSIQRRIKIPNTRIVCFILAHGGVPYQAAVLVACPPPTACSSSWFAQSPSVDDYVRRARWRTGQRRSVLQALRRESPDQLPGDVHFKRERQQRGWIRQSFHDALVRESEHVTRLRRQGLPFE
ncbi:unnamed protein product [Ixodes persulcatus]